MKKDNFSTAVIRTPRYPLIGLLKIPANLEKCTEFFQSWIRQKEVRNALTIASPDLLERVDICLTSPDTRQLQKTITTLLKYFIRMHARSTPFGMFAGVTAGTIEESTNLIPEENKSDLIRARLDFSLLCHISDVIQASLDTYSSIRFKKNPTLVRYNNSIHCVVHYISNGQRMYRLNVVEYEEYLGFLFDCEEAVEFEQIIVVAHQFIENATEADINEFINLLLKEQLIYCDIDVPVISDNSTVDYLKKIKSISPSFTESLSLVNELLENITKPEDDIENVFKEISDIVKNNKITINKKKVLRFDTYRNFSASTVSKVIKDQLLLTLAVVNQWHTKNTNEFFKLFSDKFEGKCIPLLRVLDEELGIQFSTDGGYSSDLLSGLKFSSSKKVEKDLNSIIAEKRQKTTEISHEAIVLSSQDLMQGSLQELTCKLPASFAISVTLYTDADGSDIVHLHSSHSCSAANLFTRFSYLNDDLHNIIKDIIHAEEHQFPDVIFAEVVHVPSFSHGNVASRGALRDYEIVFFAESASNSNRITLDDLWVYCEDNIVKLWSKKLDKQIIPRLTSAHNFGFQSLGIYEFLCSLQFQYNSAPSISVKLDLNMNGYSPRISLDNVIISPASWRMNREVLAKIFNGSEFMRDYWDYLVLNFKLEPWVQYSVSDNSLQVCLTNFVFWQLLMTETEGKTEVVLTESLCMKYKSKVVNSDGAFAHEIIIPYLNDISKDMIRTVSRPILEYRKDKFLPGDQWLSLKLYGAPATCENIMLESIYPFVVRITNNKQLEKFFYVRYIDSAFHIRLRFSASAPILLCIFQNLQQLLEPELQSGKLHRVEYFTYDRETERYGGQHCVDICEDIFSIESITILTFLVEHQEKTDNLRWRAALKLIDATLNAFEYSIEQKLSFVCNGRAMFGREFGDDQQMRNQLGNKYRSHRHYIEADFFGGAIIECAELIKLMHEKHRDSISVLVSKLKLRLTNEKRTEDVLGSLIHMLVNRVFISSPRQHELVVYDYLRRIYLRQSKIAVLHQAES